MAATTEHTWLWKLWEFFQNSSCHFLFVVVFRNNSSDDYSDEDIDYDDEVRDKDFVPYSSDETGTV